MWVNENGQYFPRKSTVTSDKYLFRHAFDFERADLTQLVTVDILMLENFKKFDKSAELVKIKDSMIRELAFKFATDDIKIVHMMKEILSDKFDVFMSNHTKGQAELLTGQTEILDNQNRLLETIGQIKMKIENYQGTVLHLQ